MKIQDIILENQQGVSEAKFTSQFKTKQEAVQYAKEKVQSFRDPEDGIEVWAMPDSGFNVVHTMNYSGRESVMALGGRKLGTVGPRQKGMAEGYSMPVRGDDINITMSDGKNFMALVLDITGNKAKLKSPKINDGKEPFILDLSKVKFDVMNNLDEQGVAEGSEPTEQTMDQNISDLVKDAMGTRPTGDWMQRWMAMSADKKLALYQQLASQLD